MRAVQEWVLTIADAWWVHLVVLGLSLGDGFFPTVPSESVVVTLASLWTTTGQPSILLLMLAAWIGACAGDNVGYAIGRWVGWERFRYFREGRGRRAVEFAERGLRRRALVFIMSARYIPFGRTAVNLVAGAVHYPHRKFLHRSLIGTFVWSVYSCSVGAFAGQWFAHNHLLGIGVALVAAVVLSLLLERIVTTVHERLDRHADRRERHARSAGPGSGTGDSAEAGDAARPGDAVGAGASGQASRRAEAPPVDGSASNRSGRSAGPAAVRAAEGPTCARRHP